MKKKEQENIKKLIEVTNEEKGAGKDKKNPERN